MTAQEHIPEKPDPRAATNAVWWGVPWKVRLVLVLLLALANLALKAPDLGSRVGAVLGDVASRLGDTTRLISSGVPDAAQLEAWKEQVPLRDEETGNWNFQDGTVVSGTWWS